MEWNGNLSYEFHLFLYPFFVFLSVYHIIGFE
jgi:peptidoglycan/LPS O-acetylase OafA/YrhL